LVRSANRIATPTPISVPSARSTALLMVSADVAVPVNAMKQASAAQ
jgi:hypothetical protein